VVQWFFLDGIDAIAAASPVGCQDDLAFEAAPHETESALPIVQLAESLTKVALHSAIVEPMPILCPNDVRRIHSQFRIVADIASRRGVIRRLSRIHRPNLDGFQSFNF
jgi:hypothetical protein